MNKIFKRVLSAILVLCMIPAAFITAFAHGEGVAKNSTENQSLDWGKTQYIPETVFIDGKFDDTGWAVEDWQYVDANNGTWDSERPSEINTTVSYKYQLHYDSEYFYIAAVINMPAGVTKGEFAVYLSERRYVVPGASFANRGASSGFTFTIDGTNVSIKAEKGHDDDLAGYANGKATLSADAEWKTDVVSTAEGNVVTIEFRNALDETVDKRYTVFGEYRNMGALPDGKSYGVMPEGQEDENAGNNIEYYVSMNLPHIGGKNDVGNDNDMLFHPVWAQGVSYVVVPSAENWPDRYTNSANGRNSLLVKQLQIDLSQQITIDGNINEAQWDGEMIEVNEATGSYTERPFDANSLSYSFNIKADSNKLYGAVIINAEAGKDLNAANDENKEDLGTQFELWFKGKDNRANMTMDGDVASVEYEFYKLYHNSSEYYSTELTYYINHQYTFQLYDGGKYNNERGGRELYYDVNPEAAPDYYVETGADGKLARHEKQVGDAYDYEYRVVDGKTYLEFWIDLKSVHCDVNDIEIFVSTRHMQHTNANTRNNLQLYYPKLLVNQDGTYAETSNLWVTHYNYDYNDPSTMYGIDNAHIRDAIGIIFDDYNKYKATMSTLGEWSNEVLLKQVPGTSSSYEIIAKKEAGVGAGGAIAKPTDGGKYLWYCFGVGTYYGSGKYKDTYDISEIGPVDTTNERAYIVHQELARWNLHDVLTIGFDYTKVSPTRKTVSYHGRLDANANDDIEVSHIGLTDTNHTATQEIALESAQYVKYEFDNTGGGWTFISQVHVFQGQEKKQLVKEEGVSYEIYGDSPNYPDSTKKELIDGEGCSDSVVAHYTDYRYVGMNNDLAKAEGYNLPTVIVNLGKVYENITGFNVWAVANKTDPTGVTSPEKINVYVSLDGENWEYATSIAPTQKDDPAGDGNLANTIVSMDVKSGGNRANSYYSPYTVTRIYKNNSLTINATGNNQNSTCYYWWRNRHMPAFDRFGEQRNWMYDASKHVVGAAHVAPDVIDIDDNLGDSGWYQYDWTEVDGTVNGTGKGPKFDYQVRSDGEYLYVASLVDSANPTFALWIKSNDGKVNYYEISNGTTSFDVQIPTHTGDLKADEYKLEDYNKNSLVSAQDGYVTLPYSASLVAKQWDGSSWNDLTYEDSTFYGYTKEIKENTTNGITVWEAIPETQGFRFGVESARIESADGKLIRFDATGNVVGDLYTPVFGKANQSTVEFKIALSEFDGLSGFEYFIQVKDGENSTIYPKVYNLTSGFVSDAQPDLPVEHAYKVSAKDVVNSGEIWMCNDYAPVTSLGAMINDNYDGNGMKAIRFGARFTENFIRRQKVTETEVTDYWDVADIGIIFAPASYLATQGELKTNIPNILKSTALDIINWQDKTNFADYESFVFYVNFKGFPESYYDVDFQFRAFVDYYNVNGTDTYYSQIFTRNFNGVKDNVYLTNEDAQMPVSSSN